MEQPESLLYLSHKTLESLALTTKDIIESIEYLLHGRRQSQVWNAPKAVITPPDGRYMMATLSAADDPPFLAVKSLILNPRNREHGLPDINSLVTLLDSNTGLPLAVMDGNWITAVRTAGLSAVAARQLAKSDASTAAFIGCGVQARSHLQAFSELFPLKEIRVFGRGSANREALCQAAEKLGLLAVASKSAREAVSDADLIISTVTLSPELVPFLDACWLKPGAFVTAVDLAASWLKNGMPTFDRIIIDDIEQEAQMSTPLVDPELVSGDLTGLVNGDIAGRCSDDEKTAFIFRGLALGDLALAALAYQRARQSFKGFEIER
ncbi:ornithine cyclodeaminase family protein [Nitrosomonas sp. Is37]|uniref:ornithine cyclodeaminase family protein n=1 Tax=Nitrosomonas sp. Is37 TaxID=3080535 RepID=UPI00294B7550|nr:ornithine cyclodeaminase family protein [Nitrosomonas sp. Is37]MDV6344495.1 ornithine cyclodeaminase family protein [Nitrosomonas sp. Is37]